ncbi:MAG: sensor histidine kinase [Jatrophihabitans sp.]|uniref:sensor histidine kinase n=1 Tax=Jatrophihabitans sp. TaxID=1932789 RepID=UPI003F7E7E48
MTDTGLVWLPPAVRDDAAHAEQARAAAGTGAPRRLLLRSLRSRLVVMVVGLTTGLVLLLGASTWFLMHRYLDEQLDRQVTNIVTGNLYQVFGPSTRTSSVQSTEIWAVALSPTGDFLTYPMDNSVAAMRLSAADRTRLAEAGWASAPAQAAPPGQQPPELATVRTTDGHQLRVALVPGTVHNRITGDSVDAVAVVGLSTNSEADTLSKLLRAELAFGGAAVLLGFVVTTYGVRRSLRNLYAVTGTAREVAAELSPTGAGLDRRVPMTEDVTEVGQLAESMNTLLSAVETQFAARLESEQRMRQFLADASHELRTPLTSIRGYAELARLQGGAGDHEANSDALGRIESEGTRMSRLVEDLLTLARTDQADSRPQPHLIDVAELLDDVVTSTRAAFPQRDITLTADAGLTVLGDPDQLVRVVRNLVTNAAVHTDPAGPIAVRGRREGDTAVLEVIDAGPGLPPEQAAKVFERFWRADKSRTRARGGSGLGMSIVASLVEANGGTVRFDSTVEHGSTATVRLPAATRADSTG